MINQSDNKNTNPQEKNATPDLKAVAPTSESSQKADSGNAQKPPLTGPNNYVAPKKPAETPTVANSEGKDTPPAKSA